MLRLGAVTGRNDAITVGPVRIPSERLAGIRRSLPGSVGFLVAALPLLYVLRHFNLLPMWTATLVAGQVGIVAQFLANTDAFARRDAVEQRLQRPSYTLCDVVNGKFGRLGR